MLDIWAYLPHDYDMVCSILISIASIVNAEVVDSTVERKFINTAFASYSKQNREEVFARIQGMKKIAPDLDVFVDVLSLRSGDNWKEKLDNHVPFKDTFFLFWSKDAAESEWVEREWRLALHKRGSNYIDPVPLVDPDLVQPPPELNAKHFTDAYILHIEYERFKRKSLEK